MIAVKIAVESGELICYNQSRRARLLKIDQFFAGTGKINS
ncbi:hypothetical protein O53_1628 [Microcystis aeruginosa TAIHU98]|uniref:Uncharacterized protein n=1 Tax=Microcystis aeruginosa TAIHU98 TaxID=1134457 RepID=L7EDQ9_MICAE|nr:hypothetical protein O53_1628 [Microcystis aeruginosa TAIHU98]